MYSWIMPPHELFSDFASPLDFVHFREQFNIKVGLHFKTDSLASYIAAYDMCHCFYHIPTQSVPQFWFELQEFWLSQGINAVSVPCRRSGGRECLGRVERPGWQIPSFSTIHAVLLHCISSNYIRVDNELVREERGVPMGDALSSAALRLCKSSRERTCSLVESCSSERFPASHVQLVHLNGHNMLAASPYDGLVGAITIET